MRYRPFRYFTYLILICYSFTAYSTIIQLQEDGKLRKLVLEAETMWNEQNFDQAEKLYKQILREDDSNLNGLVGLAQIAAARDDVKGAKGYFDKAFKVNDKNALLNTAYGRFLLKENQIEQAEAAFKKALSLAPNLAEAHVELAVIYLSRKGQPERALSHYHQAVSAKPNELSYRYGYSVALDHQGMLEQAIEQLQQISSRNPELYLPYRLKGFYLFNAGQFEQAARQLELAMEKGDTQGNVVEKLSAAYYQLNQFNSAIALYKKRLVSHGESGLILSKLAYAYHLSGDLVKAKLHYTKAIEIQPDLAEPYNNLAYLLADQQNTPAEALRFAQKAVALAPENADYLDTLGHIHFQLENLPLALKYLRMASQLAPDNQDIQQALSRIEKAHK